MLKSTQLEIMDTGPYTADEYRDCLEQLDRVGRWLGGDRATLAKMGQPRSILDVGCGGGHFTARLAEQFPKAHVVGIDINPDAIAYARAKSSRPNLAFELQELNAPEKSFDVVTATLVCHHIPDDELGTFITACCRIAKKRVILNDLHRHPLALFLFRLISPLCFRNRLVLHDGPLSIRRAFKRHELASCLERAGLTRYAISWHWAFRWVVTIDCEE